MGIQLQGKLCCTFSGAADYHEEFEMVELPVYMFIRIIKYTIIYLQG